MAINFDVNKGLENRQSRGIIKIISIVILLLLGSLLIYVFVGNKHTKLPGGIETNIPENKSPIVLIDSYPLKIDTSSTKIDVMQIHTGSGDNVKGDKIQSIKK